MVETSEARPRFIGSIRASLRQEKNQGSWVDICWAVVLLKRYQNVGFVYVVAQGDE